MEQKKCSDLFYKARNAVNNGTYLKTKTKTLRKYLVELSIVQPWESDPLCYGGVDWKHKWIDKIKAELQRRKDARRAHAVSVAKFCAKYILAPLIVLIIWFFLQRLSQEKQNTTKTLPQQPLKEQGELHPSDTQAKKKTMRSEETKK